MYVNLKSFFLGLYFYIPSSGWLGNNYLDAARYAKVKNVLLHENVKKSQVFFLPHLERRRSLSPSVPWSSASRVRDTR